MRMDGKCQRDGLSREGTYKRVKVLTTLWMEVQTEPTHSRREHLLLQTSSTTKPTNMPELHKWMQKRRVKAPLRKHVDDRRIVIYDNRPKTQAWAEVELTVLEKWAHRKEVYSI